jgi:hypothetical protein
LGTWQHVERERQAKQAGEAGRRRHDERVEMSIDVAGLEVMGAGELLVMDQPAVRLDPLAPRAEEAEQAQQAEPEQAEPEQWWDGLAFTGVLDPKGSLFAVLLAGFATLAVVVVAFAAVSVVTGT